MEAKKKPVTGADSGSPVRMKGAEALMESLIREDTGIIFGYPGGAIMPAYDALFFRSDELRHILVRHEQGAIHAAQGYARVSGKTGVCMVTSGPGASNVVTGLADAMTDSTPVVVITGQVHSRLLGTRAFQEVDVIGITKPITKWNCQVSRAADVPQAVAKAFYIASSGRPGPVVIDITKDAQIGELDYVYKKYEPEQELPRVPEPDIEKLDEAARLINLATRPLALIGQGVLLAGAEGELLSFLEKSGIPAAWTIMGQSALPSDHPLNVGMLGMHGNFGPNILTNEADIIIGIGLRFDDRVTSDPSGYARKARLVHMDIDPSEINKIIHADVPVVGDVKMSLPLLTQRISSNEHREWIEKFHACSRIEFERLISRELYPDKKEMTMGEVVRRVSEAFDDDAVLVTDVGQNQMMALRYFRFKRSRSVVTSGGLGTMGFGLPASIGAKLGSPGRPVCVFIGDGGFQMTIQELATLFQEQLPVKIILLNNNFLGMVRQWQEMLFDQRYASTNILNPDFQTIAKGFGIPSVKVCEREELDGAIDEMIKSEGPFLMEVIVEKEGSVFPMVMAGETLGDIRLE